MGTLPQALSFSRKKGLHISGSPWLVGTLPQALVFFQEKGPPYFLKPLTWERAHKKKSCGASRVHQVLRRSIFEKLVWKGARVSTFSSKHLSGWSRNFRPQPQTQPQPRPQPQPHTMVTASAAAVAMAFAPLGTTLQKKVFECVGT